MNDDPPSQKKNKTKHTKQNKIEPPPKKIKTKQTKQKKIKA